MTVRDKIVMALFTSSYVTHRSQGGGNDGSWHFDRCADELGGAEG